MRSIQPLLCVTVTARTMGELRDRRDAVTGADLVELRLDGVDRPDPAGAIDGRRLPVIVTCRARWEGGHFDGSEDERHRILSAAATAGAEFVDVEGAAGFAPDLIAARGGRGIVASMHDFNGTPADVRDRYRQLRGLGAEISKLAVTASSLSDSLPLFDLAREVDEDGRGHVLIAMGAAGVPSRVLAARLRNRWSYAGDAVAPGQLTPARMLRDLRFRRIRADATLYGVVGKPIGHSRSPVMHNAAFAALGMNAAYVPLAADSAEDLVRFARAMPLAGVSITAPFKVALMEHVDAMDDVARRVGAINTLVVRDGRWIGANTDVEGFLAPLRGRIELKGTRATILGAGGAARGVAIALADAGALVTVAARRRGAAAPIAELAGGIVGAYPPEPGSWDVLINATSAGSGTGGTHPVPGVRLDGQLVYDLVYDPVDTALLKDARAAGCQTVDGLQMLVAQAERQFELWTGRRPPEGLFATAVTGGPIAGLEDADSVVRRGDRQHNAYETDHV